jgi:hypothetical protein
MVLPGADSESFTNSANNPYGDTANDIQTRPNFKTAQSSNGRNGLLAKSLSPEEKRVAHLACPDLSNLDFNAYGAQLKARFTILQYLLIPWPDFSSEATRKRIGQWIVEDQVKINRPMTGPETKAYADALIAAEIEGRRISDFVFLFSMAGILIYKQVRRVPFFASKLGLRALYTPAMMMGFNVLSSGAAGLRIQYNAFEKHLQTDSGLSGWTRDRKRRLQVMEERSEREFKASSLHDSDGQETREIITATRLFTDRVLAGLMIPGSPGWMSTKTGTISRTTSSPLFNDTDLFIQDNRDAFVKDDWSHGPSSS